MKYKTKKTLKTLALSVLGIGAIVGACAGINALVEKQDTELKTIYPIFEVGGLKTEDGKFEESDGTIYTKDAFECQGLNIVLDFDNTIKYQVFYYESDGDFISATSVYGDNVNVNAPEYATHARIEITPNWSKMGEDYKDKENQTIKFYEIFKYSSQLSIKVNKEQSFYLTFSVLKWDGKEIDDEDNPAYSIELKYEIGMTWKDWLESEYNTIGLSSSFSCPYENDSSGLTLRDDTDGMENEIQLTDRISHSKKYSWI